MSDAHAVIGNPIGHTKSPLIHRPFAQATGQDMVYTAIEGRIGQFEADMDADGVGLNRDVGHNLGCPLKDKRVLVLGAGGAARGALLPFLAEGPAGLVIANRTVSKAETQAELASAHGRLVACGYGDLEGLAFDLVFNATSASLRGELPPVPVRVFAPGALAYELAYGKGLTPFLRLAQQAGTKQLADGVGMLVEQAAEAFVWWRGVRPDTHGVIDRLTVPLV